MDAYVSKPIQATELYAVMAELVKKDLPETTTTTTTTNVVATVIEPAADVLDRDDVMKRLDGDLEFLEQMTQLFQADYPNHLSEIESALKERSADRIRKAAHTLKGLAGNLGGKKAANVAMSVETLARESRLDDCPKVVAQLETSLVELHTALNALIKA